MRLSLGRYPSTAWVLSALQSCGLSAIWSYVFWSSSNLVLCHLVYNFCSVLCHPISPVWCSVTICYIYFCHYPMVVFWSFFFWSSLTRSSVTCFSVNWSSITWSSITWPSIAWSSVTWSSVAWSSVTALTVSLCITAYHIIISAFGPPCLIICLFLLILWPSLGCSVAILLSISGHGVSFPISETINSSDKKQHTSSLHLSQVHSSGYS